MWLISFIQKKYKEYLNKGRYENLDIGSVLWRWDVQFLRDCLDCLAEQDVWWRNSFIDKLKHSLGFSIVNDDLYIKELTKKGKRFIKENDCINFYWLWTDIKQKIMSNIMEEIYASTGYMEFREKIAKEIFSSVSMKEISWQIKDNMIAKLAEKLWDNESHNGY